RGRAAPGARLRPARADRPGAHHREHRALPPPARAEPPHGRAARRARALPRLELPRRLRAHVAPAHAAERPAARPERRGLRLTARPRLSTDPVAQVYPGESEPLTDGSDSHA